ncbi:hypothetical protein Q3A66_18325 [Hymenobacter sp. BT770]|uniref:hypothetical protein n=1 Tax=Hymenobacter sp. BT770 TaxID=2886942 RepID=UPI001D12BFF9|nr:hypothetical protein [Hymenobacter sp. BT770]MCC3155086.1 hypothetical protein [Hymenobacter sp. BT770]MDO3417029.1 hypothetical protein [Hymenobacter sp. BT770]
MELDDLRRKWQQPDPAHSPTVSPAQWDGLLAQESDNLVEKMRRSARRELFFTSCFTVLAAVVFYRYRQPIVHLQVYLFGPLLAVLYYYFYRKLKILKAMGGAEGHVRGHLQRLCSGLRNLLRFYYRLTMGTIPVAALLCLVIIINMEIARPGPFRVKAMLAIGGFILYCLGVGWVMAKATPKYLQKLYGRHLDHLEANLRELGDEHTG